MTFFRPIAVWWPSVAISGACALFVGTLGPFLPHASATIGRGPISVYSLASQDQFVNNEDDRSRGEGNNPFGNFNDQPGAKTTAKGPFAGDVVIVSLNLYGHPVHRSKIGSAIFTCQYDFNKLAFCDASFQLTGGVLYAAGELDFTTNQFTMAIVAGDGRYNRAKGRLVESPGPHHTQRFTFELA
jgi:hypothetical protein